ncbi:MAG TPA: F0F1 ATP synthase subunit A [Chloroflexota bacterium]|jgi:F-type H+-transporting ATPase subunit a|nr:F0F1 ATP synthase subunit A [Chloroflexota bacterium]
MQQGALGFFAQEHAAQAAATTASATPQPPAELLFDVFGLPVTNAIFTAWIVIVILVLFAFFSTRTMRVAPRGVQNFWELIIELWIGISEQTMGRRRGRRFMPLVASAFLYVVFNNWFGTLPIGYITIVNIDHEVVPLLRSANSDLNLTAAMAIMVILLAEFFELRSLGLLGYLKGLFLPNPLRWLEIFTRPLSLAFRLFGNIFAGEVLLATMLTVAPFVLFIFIGLELFVGLIQALIFSMLSLVFLSIATVHEDAHGAHDDHDSIEGELATATHGQPF